MKKVLNHNYIYVCLILLTYELNGMQLSSASKSYKSYDTSIFVCKSSNLSKLKDVISDKFYQENNLTKYDKCTEIFQNNFYLKNNETHKTAVAVFNIPNHEEIVPLTEEQTRIACQLFKVYKADKINGCYSIMFDYENQSLLPENREQALLFLLTPHLKDSFSTTPQFDDRSLVALNSAQKEIFTHQQNQDISKDINGKTEKDTTQPVALDKPFSKNLLKNLLINTNNKEINSKLSLIHKTIDHYISLISASSDQNQQEFFTNVIALLAERFQTLDSNSTTTQYSSDFSESVLSKVSQITSICSPLAITNKIGTTQNSELSILAHLLADLEIKIIFTDGQNFRNSIIEWEQQVTRYFYDSNTLNEGSFAGFSFEQILTLANDTYLRGIQRQYNDAVFNEHLNADLGLLSLLGNDFSLDVINGHEKLYKRFINTTFKSDVLNKDGKIRTVESFYQTLNEQFHQVRIRAEQEGFTTGTLVKIPGSYAPINDIETGQKVVSYDIRNKHQTEQKVLNVLKEKVNRYIQVNLAHTTLHVAFDQKFYLTAKDIWVTAYDLSESKELQQYFPNKILDIKPVFEEVEIHKLTVENNHNFHVAKDDILAHNFAPAIPIFIGIGYAIGSGVVTLSSSGIGPAIVAWLAEKVFKKSPKSYEQPNYQAPNPQTPEDPDKQKKELAKTKENWQKLNNREARKKAAELGYEEKVPDFKVHGNQLTFTNKKGKWISPDADGHNGGYWKVLDSKTGKTLFSMDLNLSKIVKTYK